MKQSVTSLVVGADSSLAGLTAVAVAFTTTVAVAAIWSATRHIARLDVVDVIRAECGE